jgi:hypothetical protein
MFRNDYVNSESARFEYECEYKQRNPNYVYDKHMFKKLMILGCIILPIVAFADTEEKQENNIAWGEVWVCKNCGFRNYEGIRWCGMCGGTERR